MSLLNGFQKILVIKLAGIGDFILALPAFHLLSQYGKKHLTLLCTDRTRGLAERSGYFQEVVSLKDPFFSWRTFFQNLKTIFELRRHGYELGVNFHTIGSLKGALLMALLFSLLGIPRRAGWDSRGRGFFYTDKIAEPKGKMHEREKHLALASTLTGVFGLSVPLELPVTPEDRFQADQFLQGKSLSPPLVGLQPAGNKRPFLWPLSHFAGLSRYLHQTYGATLFVSGNKSERRFGESLQAQLDFPIMNICGEFPLETLPAFFERLHLFISNDTGLAHLAGEVGTPLVVLFGPKSEERFAPFHRKNRSLVIHRNDIRSISEISVQEVIEALDRFLGILGWQKKRE